MSRYRRATIKGGTFFFTVTFADRPGDLLVRHVDRLRRAYGSVQQQHPFETIAICILPDHLHAIWSLKHGLVSRVCDWPYSSFHEHVSRGVLPADWGGDIRDAPGAFGE